MPPLPVVLAVPNVRIDVSAGMPFANIFCPATILPEVTFATVSVAPVIEPVKTVANDGPSDAVNGVPTEPVAIVLVPASVWPGTRVPDVTESTVRVVPVTDPLNWACPADVAADVKTVVGTSNGCTLLSCQLVPDPETIVVPSAIDADMLFGDAGTVTVTGPLVTVWEAPLMLYVPGPPGDADVWVACDRMTGDPGRDRVCPGARVPSGKTVTVSTVVACDPVSANVGIDVLRA